MNTPPGSMTKAELVEEVSKVSDLTKKHSEVIVDTVFKTIIDALHRGEKIELRGFGSFRLRKREPRKGRNPKTGDKVDVPPKKVPYFKPGKELKELINRESAVAEADGGVAVPSASSSLAVCRPREPMTTTTGERCTGVRGSVTSCSVASPGETDTCSVTAMTPIIRARPRYVPAERFV